MMYEPSNDRRWYGLRLPICSCSRIRSLARNFLQSAIRSQSALLLLAFMGLAAGADRINVRDLGENTDWAKYAREKTELLISGRYEGRFSKQFRMAKLPIAITPARTTVLPNNLEAGQRISATGVLRKVGDRYVLEAKRIVIGSTDIDRVLSAVARVPEESPELVYKLVQDYLPIAEFYDDEPLQVELTMLRADAFARQRKANAANAAGLKALVERGRRLGMPEELLQAVLFETLIAESKSDAVKIDPFLRRLQETLPGWDVAAQLAPQLEARFLKHPVAVYDATPTDQRTPLHRRFYRQLRLPIVLAQADVDGHNALEISEQLAEELPEETQAIAKLQEQYIDYRMQRVPTLSRRQLEDLQGLLKQFDREPEFQQAVNTWAKAQETRLNTGQLDGILLSAEQYLYAFERWKNPQHEARGIALLKQAWVIANEIAPQEAKTIAIQLERLGWIRLYDRWMSEDERRDLPENDIELAKREGRVVVGMHPDQVLGSQGEPAKRIRVVSGRHVREVWVYGDDRAQTINIHLERLRTTSPSEAVVTLIAKSAR